MPLPEVIAKLTASGIDPTKIFGGDGGVPELSREEIMGALGGVRRGPMYLGLVKFLGATDLLPDLCRALLVEIAGEGWVPTEPGFLTQLCSLAILEEVNPMRCPVCLGTSPERKTKRRICSACSDTGVKHLSEDEKLDALGLDRWGEWNDRYWRTGRVLAGWESEFWSGIARNLAR